VVIGPDHFERCRQKFSVTGASVMTMFGELKVDKNVMKQILDSGAGSEESCFHGEHAIGVQANYIKKFFPRAKIVPVLLSYSAGKRDFAATINELKNDRKDVFVLASVDFTHYMDVQKAESVDAITRRMINGNDGSLISLKQVDSPGTLKVILGLAKSLRLKSEIIEHRNSFYYDGIYKNTTSYFSVLF
ncbi:AmmeMemoRadiSam system protein B, partial [Candidatus Falkowbacteria bacterium]|nr:AmmeMemoRadiSam system protein B [Candidatus Falkowbacteria bacterium]